MNATRAAEILDRLLTSWQMAPSALARFRSKIQLCENGCWKWTGAITPEGYGRFRMDDRSQPSHRVAYVAVIGPIFPGLHLDHVCHNDDLSCPGGPSCPHRRCVNPWHLEPVTPHVNAGRVRLANHFQHRKTHCPAGHPYDEENTEWKSKGERRCRACHGPRERMYYKRKKAAR